ncbi:MULTISPECIES: SixA phosphatase family protein [Nitrosomonas]|uniref:Phosphohistidine phosphatase SixA n=2 Tax=Nitrosomonas eutropha TaxID=916 RepID=A0ABX5M8J7_9PROT|nr:MULTISPECIES: histidine phosphatase family protein [Nitrosomonas]ABI59435.1 phosphohistidine phosphatase, SixA [Nitrosomonas eutropha C91]MXS80023.1 histidine phosphatase family protein [Nitrosomonas sp. GH22]PXV83317.1 phosphohistidine phosphatase SixA [Nitrosomonas eutropha]SDV99843.1 phosphohistidine phosphatase, SixA [Nitrosomonas eutropha]SEI37495.1 phosphohistidine phosphatase, SixA [Nitrosomonas eutropha]
MDLILWRHAEAEDRIPDAARELTEKGLKQAQKMAGWLKSKLPPDTHIIVSPAKRTQQTASALTTRFETSDQVGTGATPYKVLNAIAWPEAEGTVLVVGHQPTLGEIASLLLKGDETGFSVRKGSVWWFSCKQKDERESIILRAVMTPEIL